MGVKYIKVGEQVRAVITFRDGNEGIIIKRGSIGVIRQVILLKDINLPLYTVEWNNVWTSCNRNQIQIIKHYGKVQIITELFHNAIAKLWIFINR